MKKYKLIFLGLITAGTIHAQPAKDSVVAAVNQLFTGMKNADTVLLKDCFSANAVMQTIKDDQGEVRVTDENPADFIGFVGKESKGNADEQITINDVKIDGPMAIVWAPYKFYYKGKFSHCGVNSFQLVRIHGRWKIQYIIDTRRKTGCL